MRLVRSALFSRSAAGFDPHDLASAIRRDRGSSPSGNSPGKRRISGTGRPGPGRRGRPARDRARAWPRPIFARSAGSVWSM
ncbi:MAG: hypothetical protein MZV64_63700 [Ignavibacteriales bacterium]|nr:hypothetical protein [Ignavibacteriales bacterium]